VCTLLKELEFAGCDNFGCLEARRRRGYCLDFTCVPAHRQAGPRARSQHGLAFSEPRALEIAQS
jgi:hypothetical protein